MYRNLDLAKTIDTIATLKQRIEERFPDSGLSKVCRELLHIANENKLRSDLIAKPNLALRFSVAVVIVVILTGLVVTVSAMELTINTIDAGELVQVAEAGLNDIVLIGAALFFLITVEVRIKRSRALTALHELRSIAHVIDMHQLTKDPGKLLRDAIYTPSSPQKQMSAYQLSRYLDYCSEMLSLTGKIAAIYAQGFRDGVVLSAVNEVEILTTGLSRKIWQKIIILHKLEDGKQPAPGQNTVL
jgi:hypothetical protein